jgi:hypothetical protein
VAETTIMPKLGAKWKKDGCSRQSRYLGLSFVVNVSTPAQNTGSAAQEQTDQMKKKAAADKKAAEAKEKWIKAQENTKDKQADLAKAKQEQEQARIAAGRRRMHAKS